jgi:FdhD protein
MQPSDISALVLGAAGRAAARMPDAPRISAASAAPLREITAVDERGEARSLHLPMERPLTIAVDGREIVTLMTLGAAPEWLVLGYLRNQQFIGDVASLQSIEVDWTKNIALVTSRRERFAESAKATRRVGDANPPGCALGTGFSDIMRQFDAGAAKRSAVATAGTAVAGAAAGAATVAETLVSHQEILAILECMRRRDAVHRAAGSVHSCALFQGAELWAAVEDVSRHNGIDTIAGFMALHGVIGAGKILFTTGRLTGEMVMKAAHNGIPVMISRNGTTAMGYELAAKLGMTLIGRAAKRRYMCYIGAERIARDARCAPAAEEAADGAATPGSC